MLIRLFLLLGAVGLAALVVTQVIIPALMGRTFFPLFSSKNREVKSSLAEANRREHEAKLEQKAEDIKARAARIEVSTHINTSQAQDDLIEESESLYNKEEINK